MAWIRISVSAAATVAAIWLAELAFAYNGYEEDAGSGENHTLVFAIPWSLATIALAGLVCGAIVSRSQQRRGRWSWWALLLAAAMALVVVAGLQGVWEFSSGTAGS
jgi:hypothetical protein